jgi:hypothetical protein
MWVRKWIERRKLLRELKSEDEIFDKKFFFIPLLLFPTLVWHFFLVSIEGFKFLLWINKEISITITKWNVWTDS